MNESMVAKNLLEMDEYDTIKPLSVDNALSLIAGNENVVESEVHNFDRDIEKTKEKITEFEKAKDRGSAQLYLSLSNLITRVAYGLAIFLVILLISWLVLSYMIMFKEGIKETKLLAFIDKIESIFKYVVSIGFGFVSGACKIFLKEKIEN